MIQDLVDFVPLWAKLLCCASVCGYFWLVKSVWRKLENRGIPVIEPKLMSCGTAGHYVNENAYPAFAKRELLDKDRKTVGLYRVMSPIIMTVDTELIQKVFTTYFHQFPSRNIVTSGTLGAGPIFNNTLDIIDDMHVWKRQRSTLSAGFSTKQLNEMMPVFENVCKNLIESIKNLKGRAINVKALGSRFAVDAFTSASFSTLVTDPNDDIADFDKVSLVSE